LLRREYAANGGLTSEQIRLILKGQSRRWATALE
jgi:hypothetical protein